MNKISLFSSQKGFTLLEVLVAMAITLFVTVIAYTSLTAAINGAEGARDAAEDLSMLQAGLGLLERDVRHIVPRGIVDEYGDRQPALSGGDTNDVLLRFTRNGWENPLGDRRSELQRVEYIYEGEELKRLSWVVLDRENYEDTLYEDVLFDGIQNIELRFLDGSVTNSSSTSNSGSLGGEWVENWSSMGGQDLPLAIELIIEFEYWGEVTRVIQTANQ